MMTSGMHRRSFEGRHLFFNSYYVFLFACQNTSLYIWRSKSKDIFCIFYTANSLTRKFKKYIISYDFFAPSSPLHSYYAH